MTYERTLSDACAFDAHEFCGGAIRGASERRSLQCTCPCHNEPEGAPVPRKQPADDEERQAA